jgi:hypothetical protein
MLYLHWKLFLKINLSAKLLHHYRRCQNHGDHRDFAEATKCSFGRVTVDSRDSDISTVIPNIHNVNHSELHTAYDLQTFLPPDPEMPNSQLKCLKI